MVNLSRKSWFFKRVWKFHQKLLILPKKRFNKPMKNKKKRLISRKSIFSSSTLNVKQWRQYCARNKIKEIPDTAWYYKWFFCLSSCMALMFKNYLEMKLIPFYENRWVNAITVSPSIIFNQIMICKILNGHHHLCNQLTSFTVRQDLYAKNTKGENSIISCWKFNFP